MMFSRKIAAIALVALAILSSIYVLHLMPNTKWFDQHASSSTKNTTTAQMSNPLNISSTIQIDFNNSVSIYDWSPDDTKILYGPSYYTTEPEPDVWTMNPDGTDMTPILTLSSASIPGISGVRYSPDGKRLLFAGAAHDENQGQAYDTLYLVDIDGGNPTKVIDNDMSWQPSWSPDGKKIVFVKVAPSNDGTDIWTVNVDGTDLKQLTNLPGWELHPIWSPDGNRIAFTHDTIDGTANSTVNVVNSDGTGCTILLNSTFSFHGQLSWTPDSSIIIASGTDDMYAFTIDGRVVRRIIASGWNQRLSHDGRKIIYENPVPQAIPPVTLSVNVATFNKPITLETLTEYASVPATVHPPLPPEKDLLVGYKIELDNVEYTFNISYRNTNMRGYLAEPGNRFLWTTYNSLNKGTTAVVSPIGTTYGIKVEFDDGSEMDVGTGYGIIEPGDPNLGGGSNIQISANIRAVTFIIFVTATGATLVSVPLPG
jgi:hypothetical protein